MLYLNHNKNRRVYTMKQYKTSIISSIIAGILICGMLAACGAAENQQADNLSDLDNQTNTVTDNQPADPETDSPEENDPDVTDPEVTDPEVTDPEVTEPEDDIPEVNVTVPEADEPDSTEPDAPESSETTEPEEADKSDVLNSEFANIIVETATAQLGVPFTSGGISPETGFDSSGFVYYCVRAAGIDFPRSTKDQVDAGIKIGYFDLAPGDIAYFSAEPGESASFCGVYVGGGLIIYSPVPGDNVKTANITTNYWTSRFVTGVRPTI